MAFFTKEEIIKRMSEKKAELGSKARADVNLALLILGSSLFENLLKSGHDYSEHPLHVGISNTRSTAKMIIGFLHDVLEDSDWTAGDLKRVGFSKRIVDAVDALSHRDDELYFDSITRCSKNKDAVDKKIEDLSHNLDQSRNALFLNEEDVERIHKYKISKEYLLAVKKGKVKAGSSISKFVKLSDAFNKEAQAIEIVQKLSSPSKKKRTRQP